MKILGKTERKNGFDYRLVERSKNCAVYEQLDYEENGEEWTVAYEVFIIKNRKESKIGDRIIEAGEVFPGNEDFGDNAWSYGTFGKKEPALENAIKKFRIIKKKHG